MMNKLFALASVSALAGLVSAVGVTGCSETTVASSPTDAGANTDVKDAGSQPDPEDDDVIESCVSTESVDATQFPYKEAINAPGACTSDEAAKISAFFKADPSGNVLVSDWSNEVSETCAACVFSAEDAEKWGPILVKDDRIANVNQGGCIELLSGKPACGEAYQQVSSCVVVACLPPALGGTGTCQTQEELDDCVRDTHAIVTGPCKEAYDKMDQECGSKLGEWQSSCKGSNYYTFEGPIKVQCIIGGTGTKADAGDGGN